MLHLDLSSSLAGGKVREVTKVIKEDSFETLQLKTLKDVEFLSSRCSQKILDCKVKGAGCKFLNDMLKFLGPKALELNDFSTLFKSLKDIELIKKRDEADRMSNKKKLSTDVDQMKKGAKIDIHSAMDEVYGGGEDEDEEYYDEDASGEYIDDEAYMK